MCDIISTVSVSSHPLYRNPTDSFYDITLTICVASFALYMTSHPHFMTSDNCVYVITPNIFGIVTTVSVSSHPLYWWYHTSCMSEITSAIIHSMIYILYNMTDTVWHHNHFIHEIRFPKYDITSRVYDISFLYLWHHRHYICEYMSTLFNITQC